MNSDCWGDSSVKTFIFFSNRRRHTIYWRDWSSDVCSSDLSFSLLSDGSIMNTEVRQGSISIEDGALRLETDNPNGRLRLNDFYDADQVTKLGDLDDLSFDFMVASSDRTDVSPVIRLWIDADGDLNTTNDRGELVFEWAYQGQGAVTQDQWYSADLTTWNAWQRSNGQNRDVYPDIRPYSDWTDADGYTPAGGLNFSEDSLVLGWSIALGSGNG